MLGEGFREVPGDIVTPEKLQVTNPLVWYRGLGRAPGGPWGPLQGAQPASHSDFETQRYFKSS